MDESDKQLVGRSVGNLAVWLGLAAASAGTLGSVGAVPAAAISSMATLGTALERRVRDRAEAMAARRQVKLLGELGARLSKVEAKEPTEDELDLFVHLWNQAIQEEDERKLELQGAFIAWYLRANRSPETVRLLGEAIRALTLEELFGFVAWVITSGSGRLPRTEHFDESEVTDRLRRYGLIPNGTVIMAGKPASLGKVLVEACRELRSPKEWEHIALRRGGRLS